MKMKILLLILILVSIVATNGQKHTGASLVDEMGEVCSEDLMARLDGFLIDLRNNKPGSRGVVIFYGRSDTEGRNAKLASYISLYLNAEDSTRR